MPGVVRLLALDSFGTLFDIKGGMAQPMSHMEVPDPDELSRAWVQEVQKQTQQMTDPGAFRRFPVVLERCLDAVLSRYSRTLSQEQRQELIGAWGALPLYPDVR